MITRRDFLKLGATSSFFLVFPIGPILNVAAVQSEFKGKIYRGTSNGKIYVSTNHGQTWKKHINLGPKCIVSRIFHGADNILHAQVIYRGHAFDLSLSANGKNWLVT